MYIKHSFRLTILLVRELNLMEDCAYILLNYILQVYLKFFDGEIFVVLTQFERRQIAAGVHPAVVGTRTNVILTLVLEILLQIAGKPTKPRLKIYAH